MLLMCVCQQAGKKALKANSKTKSEQKMFLNIQNSSTVSKAIRIFGFLYCQQCMKAILFAQTKETCSTLLNSRHSQLERYTVYILLLWVLLCQNWLMQWIISLEGEGIWLVDLNMKACLVVLLSVPLWLSLISDFGHLKHKLSVPQNIKQALHFRTLLFLR